MTTGMEAIERQTKLYADARSLLSERVGALQKEIDDAKRRKVPGIRTALTAVAEAYALLTLEIEEHRGLFDKPRSQVFNRVKVGLQKGKGAVSFDDEERVIKLIRKHLPDQADVLIQVKESVRKSGLGALTVEELKRIGCEAAATGDVVLIKPVDSEVDKLVKALLKGIEDAED
jgi:hypothetical protein